MEQLVYSKIEGADNEKPLVIIHGYLGMSDNWKTLGNQYALNGFQVHLLDMRNHGRSFHANEFNYEVMVNDVLNYCKHHNLNKINVIGHSMGGKVAMKLATSYPSLIDKLIIADISPKYYAPHHQDVMEALNAVDFSTNPTREEVQQTISNYVAEPGVVQFLMKNVYRVTPQQLGFRFNLNVFNENDEVIGEALVSDNQFLGDTLIFKGEKSNYITLDDEELIKSYFPNAIFETISNAGHWLHADNPISFFENSIKFLR